MYDWIYDHFINTIWFVLLGISLPSIGGLYMIYSHFKNQNNESNNQSNEEQLTSQNNESNEEPNKA
jgi:hypothetical protein